MLAKGFPSIERMAFALLRTLINFQRRSINLGYLLIDFGYALPRNGIFDDTCAMGRTPYFARRTCGTIPYFTVYHQRTANTCAKGEA